MKYLMRGAMIEYGSDFLGPIPNVVLFQFNPENLSRAIEIPKRPSGNQSRETTQAGDVPVEKITLTAHFSAADQMNTNDVLARTSGIGPYLAALEKMVYPKGALSGAIGKAIDSIGDMITSGGDDATVPVPREKFPRILFVWGLTKALPVIIDSMRINEQQFDNILNPIKAEVSLTLSVITIDECSDDNVAKGASEYTNLVKDAMAVSNLANTVSQVADIIHF